MDGVFTKVDIARLEEAITVVKNNQKKDIKCSSEVTLSTGTVKIYHMGKANPVIRADFKFGGTKECI